MLWCCMFHVVVVYSCSWWLMLEAVIPDVDGSHDVYLKSSSCYDERAFTSFFLVQCVLQRVSSPTNKHTHTQYIHTVTHAHIYIHSHTHNIYIHSRTMYTYTHARTIYTHSRMHNIYIHSRTHNIQTHAQCH